MNQAGATVLWKNVPRLDEVYFNSLLILLCQNAFSLRITVESAEKMSLKVEREQHAQGGDGVRDMALRALDCREGCNPRERQSPRVE